MGRTKGVLMSLGIGLACLIYATILAMPSGAQAQAKIVDVHGVGYNVSTSMAENLKSLTGKKVYVTLDSGKNFIGLVKGVGGQLVHLEKLEGKEYFDALLRIESISAIDTRFRGEQR